MGEQGTRVAVLVEEGFDDDELSGTLERLNSAGLQITLVAPVADRAYTGRHGRTVVTSGIAAAPARRERFAAIVIPGGYAPDRIRMRHAMLDLVCDAIAAGRPVGAIGHGAQVLISAGVLRGRTLTCWPSIAIDVKNAGGLYVDRPVVDDGGLITSRKVDDVAQFVEALARAIAHSRRADGLQSPT
jgi:protease I